MSTETINKDILRGGQFLVKETKAEDVFTPEDFSEEQRMMRDRLGKIRIKRLRLYRRMYEESWRAWSSWCSRT